NIIAFNGGNGITVINNASTGNSLLSNNIFSNGKLGIDLGDDGVTPNTPGGPHVGPNQLQNFPVLTTVNIGTTQTTVNGTLNGQASTTFTIEFFANAQADPSGFGEGQQFLGQTTVTTDSSGNTSFSTTLTTPSLVGGFVTATATDPGGNTSEFS